MFPKSSPNDNTKSRPAHIFHNKFQEPSLYTTYTSVSETINVVYHDQKPIRLRQTMSYIHGAKQDGNGFQKIWKKR